MSVDIYTCKISLPQSDLMCVLHSEWLTSSVNIMLIHDNQAWCGELQLTENEDLKELLDLLSLTKDTYIEESRKALTTHGGAVDFAYTLENDKFTWKKLVRKTIYVNFGKINLTKVQLSAAFEKVMDNTVKLNLNLSTKLHDSDDQRKTLEKENIILKSKLSEVLEKKKEMETTLYSQFLEVLNEKKRRIKELKKEMPVEDNEDAMENDESDHFDSDTEIDSEEEEKCSVSKTSFKNKSLVKEKHVTPPKRSRQEVQIESIPGPSGENLKSKNTKTSTSKKQVVKGIKGEKTSTGDSCVMGRRSQERDQNNSESSEDLFRFVENSKAADNSKNSVKKTKNKIIYDSDDETEINVTLANCDKDRTSCKDIDRTLSEIDIDKTPSDIGQEDCLNGHLHLDEKGVEKIGEKDKHFKNGVKERNGENFMSSEAKEVYKDSETTKKSSYKGLSSSTIDMLNQLI